jgi:hypothetical protein
MTSFTKSGLLLLAGLFYLQPSWCATAYTTLPAPTLPDEFSIGYEDTGTSELGDLIKLSGSSPLNLESATVAMSNWAYETKYESLGTSSGFYVPTTLNLYDVGPSDSLGPRFYTVTTDAFIPWRPEPDPADCGAGSTDYLASDGGCYPGALVTINFDLGGLTAPDTLIYGVAFDTQNYGYNPYGIVGPYNDLHIAMAGDAPSVGSNPAPDTIFWNTAVAANYHDGGAGGIGVFRPDDGWSPFSPAIQFDTTATPEPSTGLLTSLFFFGLYIALWAVHRPTPARVNRSCL